MWLSAATSRDMIPALALKTRVLTTNTTSILTMIFMDRFLNYIVGNKKKILVRKQ